ncbi:MAG: GNAT family N-acetyltransferase [Arachnia sp.]
MITITHFAHPSDLDAHAMFVLRVERDLWGEVLQQKVGDMDMFESAELLFARGMHPHYVRHVHLVASSVGEPTRESEVLGVATIELPMIDNPRLAMLSIVVREEHRGKGYGSALHAAALTVAREAGRSSIQAWTWERAHNEEGDIELVAETGQGSVDATSQESRFLTRHGYVLGQCELLSTLKLPPIDVATARREEALNSKPLDYEVITIRNDVPQRLFAGLAEMFAAMGSDAPSGEMDLEDEAWDADRIGDSMDAVKVADREQLLTVVRHIPSARLVGFTRLFRDKSVPAVAHQWETLVLEEFRGHGLGMLMKVINHAAVGEFWPEADRVITGTAWENTHMRAINDTLGFVPYTASGFWELRLRGSDT